MSKKLNLIARYISTAIAGTLLMMWGVINFSLQFTRWSEGGAVGVSWTLSWMLSAIVSVLPFLFGVLLLVSIVIPKPSRESRP